MQRQPPEDIAEQLLHYFARLGDSGVHFHNGAEMCCRWKLLLVGQPTQAEIDAFVSRLESEPDFGSGWQDLNMQFRYWARTQGFQT